MSRIVRPVEERFFSKVDKSGACWLWTAGLSDGYGTFYFKGTMTTAHRVAWLLKNGPDSLPGGLELDHICRVTKCVNPSHLRLLTHAENVLAGISPSAINKRKTKCKRGHDLRVDKRGRYCPTCQSNFQKRMIRSQTPEQRAIRRAKQAAYWKTFKARMNPATRSLS